jgi:hypothetical protein
MLKPLFDKDQIWLSDGGGSLHAPLRPSGCPLCHYPPKSRPFAPSFGVPVMLGFPKKLSRQDEIERGQAWNETSKAVKDTGAKFLGETTLYPFSGNPARTAPRADEQFRNKATIVSPDPFGGPDLKTPLSPRTGTWFSQPPGMGGQVTTGLFGE